MIETICFNPLPIPYAITFYTPVAITVVKFPPFRVHQQVKYPGFLPQVGGGGASCGIGFKQRKIFSYLLKRWYYEFWIDCRLCEMIAHGSSTVIIFSSKGFAAKNQKVQDTPFAKARCLNVFVTNFQRKLKHKDSQILCRFLIFRFKQRQ